MANVVDFGVMDGKELDALADKYEGGAIPEPGDQHQAEEAPAPRKKVVHTSPQEQPAQPRKPAPLPEPWTPPAMRGPRTVRVAEERPREDSTPEAIQQARGQAEGVFRRALERARAGRLSDEEAQEVVGLAGDLAASRYRVRRVPASFDDQAEARARREARREARQQARAKRRPS